LQHIQTGATHTTLMSPLANPMQHLLLLLIAIVSYAQQQFVFLVDPVPLSFPESANLNCSQGTTRSCRSLSNALQSIRLIRRTRDNDSITVRFAPGNFTACSLTIALDSNSVFLYDIVGSLSTRLICGDWNVPLVMISAGEFTSVRIRFYGLEMITANHTVVLQMNSYFYQGPSLFYFENCSVQSTSNASQLVVLVKGWPENVISGSGYNNFGITLESSFVSQILCVFCVPDTGFFYRFSSITFLVKNSRVVDVKSFAVISYYISVQQISLFMVDSTFLNISEIAKIIRNHIDVIQIRNCTINARSGNLFWLENTIAPIIEVYDSYFICNSNRLFFVQSNLHFSFKNVVFSRARSTSLFSLFFERFTFNFTNIMVHDFLKSRFLFIFSDGFDSEIHISNASFFNMTDSTMFMNSNGFSYGSFPVIYNLDRVSIFSTSNTKLFSLRILEDDYPFFSINNWAYNYNLFNSTIFNNENLQIISFQQSLFSTL
jgi:hypothetical protein